MSTGQYQRWCVQEWKNLRAMSIMELRERIKMLGKRLFNLSFEQELDKARIAELRSDYKRDIAWAQEVLNEKVAVCDEHR